MSVYIDLTEFVKNPVLSGIQRVTAQICRNWPDEELIPVKFVESKGLVILDRRLIRTIGACFESARTMTINAADLVSHFTGSSLRLRPHDVVLVPELFYDPARVSFYEGLPQQELGQYRFIVYDLIPIAYPEFFPNMQMDVICGYFRMIRRIPHCAFISEATQAAYCGRLLRSNRLSGIVLRLGSDGLGPKPTAVRQDRPMKFTAIGRFEPSKNPEVIINAFEALLREIPDLRVVFIGKVGHVVPTLADKLHRMAADRNSGLEHYSQPGDDLIRKHVDESRATVFLSLAEGFGLPPVESLWRGIPVVVAPGVPSLEKIGTTGLRIVDPPNSDNLRTSILRFQDKTYARMKSDEAMSLRLPTWQEFARQVAMWCSGELV